MFTVTGNSWTCGASWWSSPTGHMLLDANVGCAGSESSARWYVGRMGCDSTDTTFGCVRLESYVAHTTYSSNGVSQGEVTSTNPNAYPNNGYQGGKWYVLQGVRQ